MTKTKGAFSALVLPVVFSVFVAVFVASFSATTNAVSRVDNPGQEVCPNTGDGWTKYDNWADEKTSQTHDAGEGKVVVEVCVKGSTDIKYFTADGTAFCWNVTGIGTQSATVSEDWDTEEEKSEGDCHDISHASFRVANAPDEEEEEPETPVVPETPGQTLGTTTQVSAPKGGVNAGSPVGSIVGSVAGFTTSVGAVTLAVRRLRREA